MRKYILFLVCAFLLHNSFGTTVITRPPVNANDVFFNVGKNGQSISLMTLSEIKRSELESLTGRKMKMAERFAFHKMQSKLQKGINNDGTIRSKKLNKFFGDGAEGKGFHGGGFALGIILGVFGVIIAYLINDDKKRNRVKWAWIGWALWIALVLAFYL